MLLNIAHLCSVAVTTKGAGHPRTHVFDAYSISTQKLFNTDPQNLTQWFIRTSP